MGGVDIKRREQERKREEKLELERTTVVQNARNYAFQEQCFLSYNREAIFKELEQKTIGGGPEGQHAGGRHVLDNDHVISWYSDQPDALINKVNAYNGAHLFFKLDSSILSQLKPIVELYKVFPDLKFPY